MNMYYTVIFILQLTKFDASEESSNESDFITLSRSKRHIFSRIFGPKEEVCKPVPGHCECPPPNCPDCCKPKKPGQKDNKCGGIPVGADAITARNLLESLSIQGTPVSVFGGNFKFPDGFEKSPKTGFREEATIYKEDAIPNHRYVKKFCLIFSSSNSIWILLLSKIPKLTSIFRKFQGAA